MDTACHVPIARFEKSVMAKRVFVNANYKTLTLCPSLSGRGIFTLLHEGKNDCNLYFANTL